MRLKHNIPYGKQYISKEDINAVTRTLKSDFLTTGPKIKEFESALSAFVGSKYCVAVSNGTAALHLAALVLLKKGDKVLTTPNSFLATSNAILYAGAIPLFVDIQADGNINLDLCIDELEKDPEIKAIFAVAFSGNMLDQNLLCQIKKKYNINILEDCAHAIAAKEGSVKAASCRNSNLSTLSFHPVKHITTGEGGAITTNSKSLYEKLLTLRNHGMVKTSEMAPWEYEMQELGYNYRITDIQCVLGLSQLKSLPKFVKRRLEIAKKYDLKFQKTIIKPLYQYNGKSSYHLYVVKVDFSTSSISKIDLFKKLQEKKIFIQLHYIPINKQPYYLRLGYGNEKTPVMDNYYEQCFSIPMYASLSDDEQDYVIQSLIEVFM